MKITLGFASLSPQVSSQLRFSKKFKVNTKQYRLTRIDNVSGERSAIFLIIAYANT